MWFRIANGCSTWNMLSVSSYPANSSIVACRSDTERQSFALSVSWRGARSSAQSPLFHVEQYLGWHAIARGEFCACAVFYVEHSFMPYLPSNSGESIGLACSPNHAALSTTLGPTVRDRFPRCNVPRGT